MERIRVAKRTLAKRMFGFKNWQLFVDNDDRPSGFQSSVRKIFANKPKSTLPGLVRTLLTAGREHGQCRMARFTSRPSRSLPALCSMRRSTADSLVRKVPIFEIRRLHRQEIVYGKFTFETIVGPSFPLESLAEYDSYKCRTGL